MPDEVVLQLSHKDVHLGFFKERKRQILSLRSGDKLYLSGDILYSCVDNNAIARLSKNMQGKLSLWEEKGYNVKLGTIRFIVAWKPKDAPKDEPQTAVVLADLLLVKSDLFKKDIK